MTCCDYIKLKTMRTTPAVAAATEASSSSAIIPYGVKTQAARAILTT